MIVTVAGIIMIPMINPKNAFLSFHSYITSAYAVNVEKYKEQAQTPTEMISEFMKPLAGLKDLPVRILKLFKKYFDGRRDTACC